MIFNDALLKLDFTPIEATVFMTLASNGICSGYEVAKLAGLSRSNVYTALHSLQDKGHCYVIEGDTNKYIALSKSELLTHVKSEYEMILSSIDTHYPTIPIPSEPYITIKGYDNILKKIKYTLNTCESHVYIMSTYEILKLLQIELEVLAHSKKVTVISDQPLSSEHIIHFTKPKPPLGFHMIMDTSCVITGDLDLSCQCLYTCNKSLVRLMRESFITELDMIRLTLS